MENNSAELLEQFRLGQSGAAEELFLRYVGRLNLMVARQLNTSLRRRIDPEDAVHSAYRSFFLRAGRGDFVLKNSGDLWKLLVTITLNKLRRQLSHHRASKRSIAKDAGMDGLASAITRGPSPLEALAAADELESLMAKLKPWQRSVVRMRLQDHSWAEIAEEIGKPDRSVRRVISEIRKCWTERAENAVQLDVVRGTGVMITPRSIPISESCTTFLKYDEFLLHEMVGRGGMGKVYRAYWRTRDRVVSVKMLRKSEWSSPEAIERFLAESSAVSQLQHPNIVGWHGVGRVRGDGIFLVTDFVEGKNLSQLIDAKKLPIRDAIEWIARLARIVEFANSHGFVHCDLKPENVLVDHTGKLFLSDFGLSLQVSGKSPTRSWGGTPGHMAPEQLDERFGKISPATDIFALGLMLIQLITGKKIFYGTRIVQVLAKRTDDPSWWSCEETAELPVTLKKLLNQCLLIDSSRRLRSAAKLAQSLESLLKKRG